MVSSNGYSSSLTQWGKLYKRTIFFSVVGLLTSAAVLSSCFSFRSEGSSTGTYHGTFKSSKDEKPQFSIRLDLTSLDIFSRRSEFLVQLIPQNEFKSSNGTLSSNVKLDFHYFQKYYHAGQKPDPFFMTIPLLHGTSEDYPFDRFSMNFPIEAEIRQIKEDEVRVGLVEAGILNHLLTHSMASKTIETSSDVSLRNYIKPTLLISVELFRPGKTIISALIITILMWGFAFAMLALTFEFLTSETRLSPVIIAGPVILFILPSLRRMQPEIPDSICLIDMAGLFWIVVLVSISTLAMTISWLIPSSSLNSTSTSSNSSFLNCRWAPTPPKQEPQFPSFHNSLPKFTNTSKLEFLSGNFQTAPNLAPFTLKTVNPQPHSSIPTYI